MVKKSSVSLQLVKGSESEYIIKDKLGITIGRIFIIQLDKKNKYCCFKLSFYRHGSESYSNLKDTVGLMMLSLFENMNMYKISVIVGEDTNLDVFVDLGFRLEGILEESLEKEGRRFSEIIFGINYDEFKKGVRIAPLKLNGTNIELRVVTPEDAGNTLSYYLKNKTHLMSFEPNRDEKFYTLEYQRQSLIEGYKNYLNGNGIDFGIYKDNKFIGIIKISNIVYGVFKSAFVGYSIDEDYQGKGYMKEALKIVLKYCLEEMGLHRIEAATLVENKRSQSVLKYCGFEELGLNKNYLFINGKWRDHISFYKIVNQ